MRISYKWLRRYINLNASIDEISRKLTSLGLEVESIDDPGQKYSGFVVGKVLTVEKHPKADRLSVCTVQTAQDKPSVQIVCGAPNVRPDQKVIVGLPGAVVPHNQHDPKGNPFQLTNARIRGIESSGMICSEKELGLGDDGDGILVLDNSAVTGNTLVEHYGFDDVVFEIGITPNRPDCLSHIGVARDLAAAYNLSLTMPALSVDPSKGKSAGIRASVHLENSVDCPRYTARLIENVTVKESPEWLKQSLRSVGLRPINNIVDATNFIMYEFGQPLHAFDYDQLADHTIKVRTAAKGEQFTTLDGKVRTMTGRELMIADGKKSVAIGGVMGGLNSEISDSTKNVLLEAAYFLPASIRKTAKHLGITTDASYRFERGVDPNMTLTASLHAAVLIAELSGGRLVDEVIDEYPQTIVSKNITLRLDRTNAILGTSLSADVISKYLRSLQIDVIPGSDGKSFNCTVPTFRPDIEQEIDLIEEVARIHGYDNIDNKLSAEVIFQRPSNEESNIISVRHWCEDIGLNEVLTNSMIDGTLEKSLGMKAVAVKNPLSEDHECLRPSLLVTMLQSVALNLNHGASKVHVFEIGSVFLREHQDGAPVPGYAERVVIGISLSGEAVSTSWHTPSRNVDIFDIKGTILSLLNHVGLDNSHLIYYNASTSLTESRIDVEINGTYVGYIGKCNQDLLKKYKIEQEVFYGELHLDKILGFDNRKKFIPFTKYPKVIRDIAFVLEKNIPVDDVQKVIRQSGGELLKDCTLFDLFEGASVGAGKKSVAFSLSLQSNDKTLTDSEIDAVIDSVTGAVAKTFEATLRSV